MNKQSKYTKEELLNKSEVPRDKFLWLLTAYAETIVQRGKSVDFPIIDGNDLWDWIEGYKQEALLNLKVILDDLDHISPSDKNEIYLRLGMSLAENLPLGEDYLLN